MFTFSREFLEVFDRRFSDLLAADGREFVFAAREWLLWLRTDARTRLVCADLFNESDDARRALGDVVRKFLPEIVQFRVRFAQLEEVPVDAPPPRPPGPDTPGDLAGFAAERYTFRHFDLRSASLADDACGRFLPFDPLTDPLNELREVLAQKRNSATWRVGADGTATKRSEPELKAFFERLEDWGAIFDRYTPQLESVCLSFHSSAGRALRILDELLVQRLSSVSSDGDSWFADEINEVPGVSANYYAFRGMVLARETREPPSFDSAEKAGKRANAIAQWLVVLGQLVRKLGAGLRERLGGRALLVSAIERFRLRCELYDTEKLREHALSKEDALIRKAELKVTQKMARYLFDAGFDVLTEVTAGVGRADLVQMGGVYVEAKQVSADSSAKLKVIRGYTEACDGVRAFRSNAGGGVRAIVLAVYVFDGPLYEVPALLPAHGDVPETYPVIIDLRDASKRGAKAKKGPVVISADEFLAGEKNSPHAADQ